MKRARHMWGFVALLFLGLAACGQPAASSHGGSPGDYASLMNHLGVAKATVVPGGTVTQPFFAVTGKIITVNGQQVQVYEYADEESAGSDAARISPNGSTIGNSMVDWIAPPHFYRGGKIIVLYVGTNAVVIHLLQGLFGSQFAGG